MAKVPVLFELEDATAVSPGWPSSAQCRLTVLQVINWGTFSGSHVVEVTPDGFLFTGESGSGKSSLLDAMTVMLMPAARDHSLNAAARDAASGGKDRDLFTYVRGAWGSQSDAETGEAAVQYLRPGSSWSAIVMTYTTGAGVDFTIGQAFFIKKSGSNSSDVQRRFFTFDGQFDAGKLEPHIRSGLDTRVLKREFPELQFADNINAYLDRVKRRLRIESDLALRLLHKTQSAKGLNDLNRLLREFMLDEPATFDFAATAVDQFVLLKEAHSAVETARKQIEHLQPARELDETVHRQGAAIDRLQALRNGLPDYVDVARHGLQQARLEELELQCQDLQQRLQEHEQRVDEAERHRVQAEQLLRDSGGGNLEYLEHELKRAAGDLEARKRRLGTYRDPLRLLGLSQPTTRQECEAVIQTANSELAATGQTKAELRDRDVDLLEQKRQLKARGDAVRTELELLQSQRSNLDPKSLQLRAMIAEQLDLNVRRLPFAGELLQVSEAFAPWQGAIERLLHGFAQSILVPEDIYADFAAWVNDNHLGRRLVYYRIPAQLHGTVRNTDAAAVCRRLEVADGRFKDWLQLELARRYDHVCVDSTTELSTYERALTITGQVKHSAARHEKDDRQRINDRRHWLLGFDNEAKKQLVLEESQALYRQSVALEQSIKEQQRRSEGLDERVAACNLLAKMQWEDLDLAPAAEELGTAKQLLEEFEGQDTQFAELRTRVGRARKAESDAQQALGKAKQAIEDNEKAVKQLQDQLGGFEEPDLEQSVVDGLAARFGQQLTLDTLQTAQVRVGNQINDESSEAEQKRAEAHRKLEKIFVTFNSTWPVEAADLNAEAANVAEYLKVLEDLEVDRLPDFEGRFLELLQQQSNQCLINLRRQLQQEAMDISDRIEPVNGTLGAVEFYPGTHLHLKITKLHHPEVVEFNRDLSKVLSNRAVYERDDAYKRFQLLEKLIARLRAETATDRAWRDLVLDVRRHVEFRAVELDAEGNEVQIHNTGRGQSGGQRQKLVTFCLAAALRYQLGGKDAELPTYATVVLDEAFDKADSKFTRVAMQVFQEFGFQMVIATPLKLIEVLDEFVGGTALVQITDRRYSSVTPFAIKTLRSGGHREER